jgi:hypothetical protein
MVIAELAMEENRFALAQPTKPVEAGGGGKS